eukprot:1122392-Amphidinium_carterae.1
MNSFRSTLQSPKAAWALQCAHHIRSKPTTGQPRQHAPECHRWAASPERCQETLQCHVTMTATQVNNFLATEMVP